MEYNSSNVECIRKKQKNDSKENKLRKTNIIQQRGFETRNEEDKKCYPIITNITSEPK